jgi:hypothetical protein
MNETFKKSYETLKIESALSALQIGQTITYGELSKIVGDTVKGGYSPLTSARRALEGKGEYVFGTLNKIGVKRLADAEIVQDTSSARVGIARKAKKAIKRLSNIQNFNNLSEEEKRSHQAHAVIYTKIADQASSSNLRTLLPTVTVNGNVILAAVKDARK